MKVIGLTGGIGSGKTTVANMFKDLGVPIYIADDEAKLLMNRSKVIKRKLETLLGTEAYIDGKPNKTFIASKIFKDKLLLEQMNAIVHPKVAAHFKKWTSMQTSPYVIKEAAILFENGSYRYLDFVITVTAPLQERMSRVLKRDDTTLERVKAIIENQWSDAEKIKQSHFVVVNKDLLSTKAQVENIHKEILKFIS
jgi:dephospho-CoA kinase